jgi:hypothetical protein
LFGIVVAGGDGEEVFVAARADRRACCKWRHSGASASWHTARRLR